ncbi:MAG: phenylalanine--tRNA ligase beta subunit-related protein, partial [Alphaproteobacteria bacterium]|nr:phenylalanine--tRNA ligase beta subunit-related protein [Alphaproteobacteria bacterium]
MIAIGEKSINNIVDITNYVQFSINKPIHGYDLDSVKDRIIVRFAEDNEKLITLDDRELELNNKTLVIADSEKVLGLAGIKGGKYSGIDNNTKNIIIESANFDPVLIRKTSQRYNIRTDASKRFENGLSDNLSIEGIEMSISLIAKLAKEEGWNIIINNINDNHPNKNIDINRENIKLSISSKDIYNICLIDIDKDFVVNILTQLGCDIDIEQDIEDDYIITIKPPKNRLD